MATIDHLSPWPTPNLHVPTISFDHPKQWSTCKSLRKIQSKSAQPLLTAPQLNSVLPVFTVLISQSPLLTSMQTKLTQSYATEWSSQISTTRSTPKSLHSSPTQHKNPSTSQPQEWLVLPVCLINAHNLVNKLSPFQSFSVLLAFGITVYDNEILPSHSTIFRHDRPFRGGGVVLAISKSISTFLMFSPPDLEVVSVVRGSKHPITFCIVYVPLI